MLIGFLFGLGVGFLQAMSYIFSRRFLTEHRSSSVLLFALNHTQMGVVALLALPFFWRGGLPAAGILAWPLLGTAGFYLTGQLVLFRVLKQSDSSLIAPLLGFKIPAIGLISVLFLGHVPSAWGWMAIFACTGAGLLIAPPRSLPQVRVLLVVLFVCLCYSCSDLCIPRLVNILGTTAAHPILLAVCVEYITCGLFGLALLLPRWRAVSRPAQIYAAPSSAAWLLAMGCLYACFHYVGHAANNTEVGVLFGNMLQATRGPLAVLLGGLVGWLGWLHIDSVWGDRRLFVRRLAAALLMAAAIVLYLETR